MIVAEKARPHTAPKVVGADLRSLIQVLEGRIAGIDERIDALIQGDDRMRSDRERLLGGPGIGPAVTRVLLVDLPELGSLGRRQVRALVGLAPLRGLL